MSEYKYVTLILSKRLRKKIEEFAVKYVLSFSSIGRLCLRRYDSLEMITEHDSCPEFKNLIFMENEGEKDMPCSICLDSEHYKMLLEILSTDKIAKFKTKLMRNAFILFLDNERKKNNIKFDAYWNN